MEKTIATPKPAQIRAPKQSRSKRTLERIVAASLELLEAEGLTGLTVHKVVAKAGSSVGSFYARFDGKEDLLDYLGERVWTEALERWEVALETRDWLPCRESLPLLSPFGNGGDDSRVGADSRRLN